MPTLNHKGGTSRKVLVLGHGSRSFLSVIRSLGRHGLEVHIAWCSPSSIVSSSRYVTKYHKIAKYSPDSSTWKDEFIELLKKERFDLVVPCDDITILPLQYHRNELGKYSKFYLLDDDTYAVVNDKAKTSNLAKSVGIPMPAEELVSSLGSAMEAAKRFGYPLVLKPLSSYSLDDLSNKNWVKKIHSEKELVRLFSSPKIEARYLAQAYFIGQGVGIEILAKDGAVLYAFQHERIHEPMRGGGSSYRKSVPLTADLLEASERLIKELRYTGVAMMEFRVNKKTKEWVLLEINGRFWGSLPLAVAAGADFPFFLYELLVNDIVSFRPAYKVNLYCRNILMDLGWFKENLLADRSDPTLHALPLRAVFAEILHVISFGERFDTLVMDDLLPGLVELYRFLRMAGRQLSLRLAFKLISLPLMRSFYASRAKKSLRTATSILFVCKGNVCRSPFAEHYTKRLLSNTIRLRSAGYFPKANRSSPPEALSAANEYEISLDRHRSCLIDRTICESADVIFIFDRENYLKLVTKYPQIKKRVFPLKIFDKTTSIQILDPWGKGVEAFRAAYRDIARSISLLIANLPKA